MVHVVSSFFNFNVNVPEVCFVMRMVLTLDAVKHAPLMFLKMTLAPVFPIHIYIITLVLPVDDQEQKKKIRN